jgi:hypothetical protein
MSAEDGAVYTMIPRLTTADANRSKIHLLESVLLANGSETLPSLRHDIDVITAAAARLGDCRLIVIDPVSAYLEGDGPQVIWSDELVPITVEEALWPRLGGPDSSEGEAPNDARRRPSSRCQPAPRQSGGRLFVDHAQSRPFTDRRRHS